MALRRVSLACACALLLAVPCASLEISMPRMKVTSEAERISSLPMHLYKKDCWKKRPVSLMQQKTDQVPGAGLDKVVPFETVLKDGFFASECVKDYMYNYGDKFGKNKLAYNQAKVSNVSIVHYDVVVPSEDQEAMTQSVCFAFCRTVPEMLFFGIMNGRDCYCAPYYKPMADDDAICDAVCEGDGSQMCGSKSKSSMFAMHSCDSTAKDLADSSGKMEGVDTDMMKLFTDVGALATDMQAGAAALQLIFGKVGDVAAGNLMQMAKVFAGELEHATEGATALNTDISALKSSADSMKTDDFSVFAKAQEAEEVINKMDEVTTAATQKVEELEDLKAEASPPTMNGSDGGKNNSLGYYSAMHFVDKESENMSSTCDGDVIAKPIVGNVSVCASACDAQVGSCVGYQYFVSADVTAGGLCFLFSKVKTITFYSGCGKPTFLQQTRVFAGDKEDTQCRVKFQDFVGTTLKPDPSGKCKLCFKKATNAKRCWK